MGYTGAVGTELLNILAKDSTFHKVVLIGRRKVEFDDPVLKTWEQRIVDFDHLSKHTEDFKNFDIGFCSFGSISSKVDNQTFRKIDHDYVIESAMLAKEGGCEEYHYVSSVGANKNSMIFYLKTKGEIEESLARIRFKRLCVYRPKVLIAERNDFRIAESLSKFFLKPVIVLAPTALSIPVLDVARAMINNSKKSSIEAIEIVDNATCHQLSKEEKKN
ncbi:DgyrCDS12808 [Dimorphilus gyrociliatus]|uniref:DgyrCDS12808 n=1 Tax=Dimorphilus gyrociliatus TaxID=2664684 RepID=A0A7I8W8U2_9ANNE|nr:DgyrCDS12808 [Dimorphilus gyrociliatus]